MMAFLQIVICKEIMQTKFAQHWSVDLWKCPLALFSCNTVILSNHKLVAWDILTSKHIEGASCAHDDAVSM